MTTTENSEKKNAYRDLSWGMGAIRKRRAGLPVAKGVDALVKRLADMTDDNDHTGAVVALARWYGDGALLKQARGVALIHEGLGSMPAEVSSFRLRLCEAVLAGIRAKYGDAVADKINSGF